MKKVRKLIAAVAAMAMVLTSFASVSATTYYTGIHFPDRFNDWAGGVSIPANTKYTYTDRSGTNFWTYVGSGNVQINTAHVISGARSLRIKASNSNASDGRGDARIRFNIPADYTSGSVTVSFITCNDNGAGYDWLDYATVGEINWDSTARLKDSNTMWSKTYLGTPENLGGLGDPEGSGDPDYWYRYEATFTPPEDVIRLDFAAFGWSYFIIDDIVVTDGSGNVIFSEDFEIDTVSSTLLSKWTYTGTDGAIFRVIPASSGSMSNHVLSIMANDKIAAIGTEVPIVEGNTYTLSYKTYNSYYFGSSHYERYVALGMTNDYEQRTNAVAVGSSAGTYETTFNCGGNTNFRIAARYWGEIYIDDICLKDSNGKIVFFEDFEEHDREFSSPHVKIGGASKYRIDATGTATITASVANNKETAPFSCYLVAAVYDSTGTELKDIVYDNAALSKNTRKDYSLSVPVENGQKLRLFWWDNLTGNIKPVDNYDGTPVKSWNY